MTPFTDAEYFSAELQANEVLIAVPGQLRYYVYNPSTYGPFYQFISETSLPFTARSTCVSMHGNFSMVAGASTSGVYVTFLMRSDSVWKITQTTQLFTALTPSNVTVHTDMTSKYAIVTVASVTNGSSLFQRSTANDEWMIVELSSLLPNQKAVAVLDSTLVTTDTSGTGLVILYNISANNGDDGGNSSTAHNGSSYGSTHSTESTNKFW
jgi:hypothetical protein